MWEINESTEKLLELEKKITEYEPDFLIGLYLYNPIPNTVDIDDVAEKLLNYLHKLPRTSGAHYKIKLHGVGLDGFVNVYYASPGMGSVFSYDQPILVGPQDLVKSRL
ncbi:MAG: hypothetical protein ACE5IC_03245 [Candidatus Brocadiales bacterium]